MSTQLDQDAVALVSMSVARLRPYARNARTHSKKQIRQIADSIQKFGFTNPVLISDDDEIIAGHGRVEAAKLLGMQSVPTLRLSHLDAAQRRAYFIADNKLALNAGWDRELLATELQALIDLEFDVEITGFSSAEIDLVLDEARPQGLSRPFSSRRMWSVSAGLALGAPVTFCCGSPKIKETAPMRPARAKQARHARSGMRTKLTRVNAFRRFRAALRLRSRSCGAPPPRRRF